MAAPIKGYVLLILFGLLYILILWIKFVGNMSVWFLNSFNIWLDQWKILYYLHSLCFMFSRICNDLFVIVFIAELYWVLYFTGYWNTSDYMLCLVQFLLFMFRECIYFVLVFFIINCIYMYTNGMFTTEFYYNVYIWPSINWYLFIRSRMYVTIREKSVWFWSITPTTHKKYQKDQRTYLMYNLCEVEFKK